MTQQAFMSDIPSQMNPSPVTVWRFTLIFMLFVFTFKSNGYLTYIMYRFWNMTFVSRMFDSRDIPHFVP